MKKIWKWFKEWWFLILFVMYLILRIGLSLYITDLKQDRINEMNQQELHYDADGLFMMIDKSEGMSLIGVYYGTEPLFHTWSEDTFFLDEGVHVCPVLVTE